MWIQTCKGDAEFRDAFGDSVSCTGVSKDQGQTIEALVLTDESAQLLVEAGNAHEQTGLTPARLAEDLAAARQEIARLRAALSALELSANTVARCYTHRPENFAAALQSLEDDAAAAREALNK